jgi:hypothetical protein
MGYYNRGNAGSTSSNSMSGGGSAGGGQFKPIFGQDPLAPRGSYMSQA